jgi:CHAT domain-containing protein
MPNPGSLFSVVLYLLLPIAPLVAISAVQAQTCTPGPDCEQQLYRGILQTYTQELAAAQRSQDLSKQAEVINQAGEAHQYFGEFKPAIALYQQALGLTRQAQDRQIEEQVLTNLAKAYTKQTSPDAGTRFLEQQLQQVKGDRESQKVALKVWGQFSINLGNYQNVLAAYHDYLPLIRQDKDRPNEAAALWNSAIALNDLGKIEAAVAAMETAITLQDPQAVESTNIYLAGLAELYLQQGDIDEAGRTYDLIAKRSLSNLFWITEAYEGLATAYAAIQDLESAQDRLQGILELSERVPGLAKSLQQHALDKLSLTYAWQGDYAKAIATQQKIADLTGNPAAVMPDHLGAFYLRDGQFSAAETALRQAIDLYGRSRSSLSAASNNLSANSFDQELRGSYNLANPLYRNLEEALIGQDRLGEALEISEAGRARASLALLANRLGITAEILPNRPSITLERIKQVAKTHNSTLIEYSVIYTDIVGRRSSLFPFRFGTAARKPTKLHIWVVKPTGEIVFRSVDLSQKLGQQSLAELVRTTRSSLGTRGANLPKPTTQKLQQLDSLLIQPIADLLPTDPTQLVTIIPQDELFLVPFVALQDANSQYLIQRHTLLSAPSIEILELTSSLKAKRAIGNSNAPALVVGNPQMPSLRVNLENPPQPLSPLPGTEDEARAIAQLLNIQPWLGNQATETKIKAEVGKARLVHFATHGILENFLGYQSALSFTPSQEDDGFLTAQEVLRLKLNADLVVLSACDTGRGSISSDGVLGIARSFISAGTPSLIVSLWAIPDASTASLMTQFYKNLQTQPNKAQALRQAMLTTMQQYPSPQDWAAFTLMGEAQ